MVEMIEQARAVRYDPATDTIQLTDAKCDEEDIEELNLMLTKGTLRLTKVKGWAPYNYLAQAVGEDELPGTWLIELIEVGVDDPFED